MISEISKLTALPVRKAGRADPVAPLEIVYCNIRAVPE